MWPNTFNKKSATISGWQALGDFAAVKQQLQKIRASTRISSKKDVVHRPLPPLPGAGGQSNKSVRFSLPLGPGGRAGQMISGSEGSGSDQGYESDQSRVSQGGREGGRDVDVFVTTGEETTAGTARPVQQADKLQAEEQPDGGGEKLRPAGNSDTTDGDPDPVPRGP